MSHFLEIEQLESKCLLSGNVTAQVIGDSLWIEGDTDDNSVELVVESGNILLRGLENTTINGDQPEVVLFRGQSSIGGSLHVQLREGNDQFEINSIVVGQTSFLRGSYGDDDIAVRSTQFTKGLFVYGGTDADRILFQESQIGNNLFVFGMHGHDTILANELNVGHDFFFFGGRDNDAVVMDGSTVQNNSFLFGGGDNDTYNLFNSDFSNKLMVFGAGGDDTVNLSSSSVATKSFFDLGSGNDNLIVNSQSSVGSRIVVIGGGGSDATEINNFAAQDAVRNLISVESFNADDSLIEQRLNGTFGANTRAAALFAVFNPSDTTELVLDVSANNTIESSDVLLTENQDFNLAGTAAANATIDVDVDGDGQFDDGSTLTDDNGVFSLDVSLQNNDTNNGLNAITVRSQTENGAVDTESIDVHFAVGTVVRFDSSQGQIDVELLDSEADRVVENFRSYIASGAYENSIFHRSVRNNGEDFIIQGGGFALDGLNGDNVVAIPKQDTVNGQFRSDNSNVRGTIAMALPLGNPDGITNEFFFNLNDANAASLDAQEFTVFGRIIGTGLTVADQIQDLPTFDVSTQFGLFALTDVPLVDFGTGETANAENFVILNSVSEIDF